MIDTEKIVFNQLVGEISPQLQKIEENIKQIANSLQKYREEKELEFDIDVVALIENIVFENL